MRRAFLFGLAALALSACASSAANSNRFSGAFDWSFETSSFTTDDNQGPYWLSASEPLVWNQVVAPIRTSGGGPWGRLHLVVEGELSAPGHYGHLGAYQRELRVTRVIESTLISASAPPSGS
jgi:hypothetical protein